MKNRNLLHCGALILLILFLKINNLYATSWHFTGPESINVNDFGAKADGISDDAPAIRKAVEYATQNGVKKIIFGSGTYLLKSTKNSVYIPLFSNLAFIGQGRHTILLQGSNSMVSEDPKIFFSRNFVENIKFEDFVIDQNGEKNLGTFVLKRSNIAIGANHCSNIIINNIRFQNNAGRQTIVLGGNYKKKGARNIAISNCYFSNMGDGVAGNVIQNDHSSIYVIAEGFECKNNIFRNPPLEKGQPIASAIENHSSNATIMDNQIYNYKNVFVIGALVSEQVNSIYSNNTGNSVLHLAEFWVNNFRLNNITLSGNRVIQNLPAEAVSLSRNIRSPIGKINILNNSFTYVGVRSKKYSYPAISSKMIAELNIRGNEFSKIPSAVFQNQSINNFLQNIDFSENTIIDCGNTETDNMIQNKTGVLLNGSSGGKLVLSKNRFKNSNASEFIKQGVIIDNYWKNMVISDNEYLNIKNSLVNNKQK